MTNLERLVTAAAEWHNAGCCVLPAAADGTKRPAVPHWRGYIDGTRPRPTLEQVVAHLVAGTSDGIGVVCGQISDELEMVELEGRAAHLLVDLQTHADNLGLRPLLDRVTDGYSEHTPTGGVHFFYRVTDAAALGNLKLAQHIEDGEVRVLAETRGHGGWVVVAPSYGRTHQTGQPYTWRTGRPADIAQITAQERDELHRLFRLLDTTEPAEPTTATPRLTVAGQLTPGDDYNRRATWDTILGEAGWTVTHRGTRNSHPVTYWRRPGKSEGVSATTGGPGDHLWVFTTSSQLPDNEPLSKFAAYAHLHHRGDFSAAARALRTLGYGEQNQPQRLDITGLILQDHPTNLPAIDGQVADQLGADPDELATLIRQETIRSYIRIEAQETAGKIKAAAGLVIPPSHANGSDYLNQPDTPVQWAVHDLLPSGGNATLTAAYKTGKTTLVGNLVKAYCDNEPFLGRFDVEDINNGTVALFNYELSADNQRRWLAGLGIRNPDRFCVWDLRGYRLPIVNPAIEQIVADWLAEHRARVWIIDPFARAFVGCGDENSNGDVSTFLDTIDVIKQKAGVTTVIMPVHTGRRLIEDGEAPRARGATRLDDWPDSRWILRKGDQNDPTLKDRRYFSASGRDVELPAEALDFDQHTGRLTIGGQDPLADRRNSIARQIMDYVAAHPGCSGHEIEVNIRGRAAEVRKAREDLIQSGALAATQSKRGPGMAYYTHRYTPLAITGSD